MKLTVVRHGETTDNIKHLQVGQGPGRLSKLGKQQVVKLGEALKKRKFDFIYCSDLKRCKDTLKAIAKHHQHIPVIFTEELRERNMGVLEGITFDEHVRIRNKFKGHIADFRPKKGESVVDQRERIKIFFNYIKENHPKDKILLVTHAGVLRAVMSVVQKIPIKKLFPTVRFENTAICEYELVGKKVKVLAFNDARHLKK